MFKVICCVAIGLTLTGFLAAPSVLTLAGLVGAVSLWVVSLNGIGTDEDGE